MNDKDERKVDPFPELQKPSKEIELLYAVKAQLARLQHLPACKRREALEVYLTEMLNIPFVPSYESIQAALSSCENKVTQLSATIASSKAEADRKISLLESRLANANMQLSQVNDLTLPSQSKAHMPRIKRKFWLLRILMGPSDISSEKSTRS